MGEQTTAVFCESWSLSTARPLPNRRCRSRKRSVAMPPNSLLSRSSHRRRLDGTCLVVSSKPSPTSRWRPRPRRAKVFSAPPGPGWANAPGCRWRSRRAIRRRKSFGLPRRGRRPDRPGRSRSRCDRTARLRQCRRPRRPRLARSGHDHPAARHEGRDGAGRCRPTDRPTRWVGPRRTGAPGRTGTCPATWRSHPAGASGRSDRSARAGGRHAGGSAGDRGRCRDRGAAVA